MIRNWPVGGRAETCPSVRVRSGHGSLSLVKQTNKKSHSVLILQGFPIQVFWMQARPRPLPSRRRYRAGRLFPLPFRAASAPSPGTARC